MAPLSVTAKFRAAGGSRGAAGPRSCPSAGRPTRSRARPAEARRRQGTEPRPSTTRETWSEGRQGSCERSPGSPTCPRAASRTQRGSPGTRRDPLPRRPSAGWSAWSFPGHRAGSRSPRGSVRDAGRPEFPHPRNRRRGSRSESAARTTRCDRGAGRAQARPPAPPDDPRPPVRRRRRARARARQRTAVRAPSQVRTTARSGADAPWPTSISWSRVGPIPTASPSSACVNLRR